MPEVLDCPKCNLRFEPKRSNQKYCSDQCRKNAARGNRDIENKKRNSQHFERAKRVRETVYAVAPKHRLGVMRDILQRLPEDGNLRNILTDPALLSESPRADNRMNIAQAASAYTKTFFGVSITTYVRKIRRGEEVQGIPVQRICVVRKTER